MKGSTLWECFLRTARENPSKEALVVIKKGKREGLTFAELLEKGEIFSRALQNLGFQSGKKCVLLAQTGIPWVVTALAIVRTKTLLIPLDPTLSKREIGKILREAKPDFIIVSSDLVSKIDKTFSKKIYLLEKNEKYPALEDLILESLPEFKETKAKPQDPLIVPYTSGTTGRPKGAVLTHEGFFEITCLGAIKRWQLTPEDIILTIGPFHHIMGWLVFLTVVVVRGAKLIYTTDYREILKIFAKEKVTILVAPPKLYSLMYQRIKEGILKKGKLAQILFKIFPRLVGKKIKNQFNLERLKFFLSGSAPISPELIKGFRSLGFGFVNAYGMSENASLTNGAFPFDKKPGAVGPSIEGVEEIVVKALKFKEPETEKEEIVSVLEREKEIKKREEFLQEGEPILAKPFEEGEVWMRGKNIMRGYLNNPEMTQLVLRKDGWFRSGDCGYFDKDGWLYLKGRLDEVVVLPGGKNVALVEVENVLSEGELVEEVVVKFDSKKQRLVAKVYPNFEKLSEKTFSLKESEIYLSEHKEEILNKIWQELKSLQEKLASWAKISKKDIELVGKPFPKTSTQKIKRHLV